MAETIRIQARTRSETGTGMARRLRRAGIIPAVMNRITGESVPLQLNRHDFENMLRHHLSEQLMVNLEVDEQPAIMVLLREVQHHPVHLGPLHADFGEVSMSEKMHVSIPLVLLGEAAGVKNQGGVLEQLAWEVEVSCLPGDMGESFSLDISALQIGETLTARDLGLEARYDLISDPDMVLVTVIAPRLEAESAETEEASAEPEVIGQSADAENSA